MLESRWEACLQRLCTPISLHSMAVPLKVSQKDSQYRATSKHTLAVGVHQPSPGWEACEGVGYLTCWSIPLEMSMADKDCTALLS